MEAVGAVLGAAVGSVLTCVFNQLGVNSLSEETQTLRNKKGELIARENEVNEIIRIAEVEQGKKRTSEAQNWLTNANNVINKADDVDKEANLGKRCLSGVLPNCCSPNCCSRLKLLKQILKLIEEMVDLLDEASRFSEESLTSLGMEMPTTRLIGTTADKNFKMVWEWLVGDEFQKIGVYGMGGVGKTTIMKKISNQLVQHRSRFENVLWVTVSKDVDAQKLQKQIAKLVGLDLSDVQDEARRSSSLLSAFQRKGKFILFLDDIWDAFDLHELGVPEPSKDNGCKIVLTTRSLEVCGGMLCQKEVKVEQLSEDEAWELFLVNVAEEIVPEVEETAKALVVECCGLPLAVITIGRAMRRKDKIEWQIALTDLRESTSLNIAMEEKVIQRLKFSYDQLRENHQKCFLYCALFPEDYEIYTPRLIEYWVMEGLVKGSSKEDEMLRGRVILNILKRCCLLEEVSLEGRVFYGYRYGGDGVKLHDLIRDMALYITKSNPKFMVRTGFLSEEVPHEDDWLEDLERVSFMHSGIENISVIPKSPKLSTLIFAYSRKLCHIPPGFFIHMKSLRVLDLSSTRIESLPDSVSDLVNLHGLLLYRCHRLVRVPSLSKLQSLRVLKISYSAIEELPQGMEMLVNLRSLDLGYNYKLKEMIPSGLISKFSLLQVLHLQRINVYARERGGDFVQELSSLTDLESLYIKFHELSDFIAYGEFGNFESLQEFSIETEGIKFYKFFLFFHKGRDVSLCNSKGIPCNSLSLPKRTQRLLVRHFNEMTRLSELLLNDLTDLREIVILSCNSIEFIVAKDKEGVFLERIEKMLIEQCHSLSKIYEKVPAHGAFSCLKMLVIRNCHNIKIFLSSRLLKQLRNLEWIEVQNCEQLEELIAEEEEELGEGRNNNNHTGAEIDYTVALPRLRNLRFSNLPKMNSIWKGVMVCDSLQTVEVFNCHELKRLPPFNKEHQSAPLSLKTIKGSREWWDSLEWDYPCPEHLFNKM